MKEQKKLSTARKTVKFASLLAGASVLISAPVIANEVELVQLQERVETKLEILERISNATANLDLGELSATELSDLEATLIEELEGMGMVPADETELQRCEIVK